MVAVPKGVDEDDLRDVPGDVKPVTEKELVEALRAGDGDNREAGGDADKPRSIAISGPVREENLAPVGTCTITDTSIQSLIYFLTILSINQSKRNQ